jgi:surface antigen
MKKTIAFGLTGLALLAAAPALAQSTSDFGAGGRDASRGSELAPYLQCVPYAREISGIRLYGDAHTWWQQAEGRYATGNAPKVGAVMAFRPHRNMQLGHVAAVSRVVDSRTVLLDHANWSPINGRRGQIERDVMAVDVSPANDWSAVRVWYHPLGGLGKTEWPVDGFIYSDRARSPVRIAQAPQGPVRMQSSRRFLSAFNEFSN